MTATACNNLSNAQQQLLLAQPYYVTHMLQNCYMLCCSLPLKQLARLLLNLGMSHIRCRLLTWQCSAVANRYMLDCSLLLEQTG